MRFHPLMLGVALGVSACTSAVSPAVDGGVVDHVTPGPPQGPICPRADYESWRTGEVYHLDQAADEINAVLRPDGVVRWRLWGCDLSSGTREARWRASSSTTIRVEPAPGDTEFYWPGGVGASQQTLWVELERDLVLGTLRAVGGSPTPPESHWTRGWVCKVCVRGGVSLMPCDGDVPASYLACP